MVMTVQSRTFHFTFVPTLPRGLATSLSFSIIVTFTSDYILATSRHLSLDLIRQPG